jgi:hypothetical protein
MKLRRPIRCLTSHDNMLPSCDCLMTVSCVTDLTANGARLISCHGGVSVHRGTDAATGGAATKKLQKTARAGATWCERDGLVNKTKL